MFILYKEKRISHIGRTESSMAVSRDSVCAELIPVHQESSSWTTANKVLSKKYSQHQNKWSLCCNARGAITAKETLICSWEFSQNKLHFPLSTIQYCKVNCFMLLKKKNLLFCISGWVITTVINELPLLSCYSRLFCIAWRTNTDSKCYRSHLTSKKGVVCSDEESVFIKQKREKPAHAIIILSQKKKTPDGIWYS